MTNPEDIVPEVTPQEKRLFEWKGATYWLRARPWHRDGSLYVTLNEPESGERVVGLSIGRGGPDPAFESSLDTLGSREFVMKPWLADQGMLPALIDQKLVEDGGRWVRVLERVIAPVCRLTFDPERGKDA